MKKVLFALLFALAFSVSTVFAAPVFLTCDPQTGVDWYNVFLNDVKVAESVAVVDVETGLYYLMFDLVSLNLVDGDYIATVTAENEWGESGKSNPCPFTKVVPSSPQNLRRVFSE